MNNISKYLWSTYYIPQTVPGARNRNTAVKKNLLIKVLLIICYMVVIQGGQSLQILSYKHFNMCRRD